MSTLCVTVLSENFEFLILKNFQGLDFEIS